MVSIYKTISEVLKDTDTFYVEKLGCPYCDAARKLLPEGTPHLDKEVYVDLDKDFLTQYPKHKTYPKIFYKGTFIGGYTQLDEHLKKQNGL